MTATGTAAGGGPGPGSHSDSDPGTITDQRQPDSGGPPGAGTPPGGVPTGTGNDRWALLRLALAVALIVAVFALAGLGDLLIVIVAIIIMVMIHELGHFATAKWSHMKVTEYFVGFGPRLWSIRRGETDYGVKPILAGGYVKIPGMTHLEEIDPADEPRTYRQQPFFKRIIVGCAGSFMHFVMAFALAWVALVAFGPLTNKVAVVGFTHFTNHVDPAKAAGLKPNDIVLTVDGHPVSGPNQLSSLINKSAGHPVRLKLRRDGKDIERTVVPVRGQIDQKTQRVRAGGGKGSRELLGISENYGATSLYPENPVRSVGSAFMVVGHTTSVTITGLGHIFSPNGLGNLYTQVTNAKAATKASADGDRVSSIVGATSAATDALRSGVNQLVYVLIALNIVIGIVNMLPMLPLDGGHVAIAIYGWIRTRRGKPYYQVDATKLLPVVYVFVAFLLVIVSAAVFLDIAHPIHYQF